MRELASLQILLFTLLLSLGQSQGEDSTSFLKSVVIGTGQTATDVVCILCSARIAGTISGDVVTIGGDVDITGTVDGDVVTSGGSIRIEREGRVGGDSIAVGGTVSAPRQLTRGDVLSFPYFHLPGQRSFHPLGILTFLLFFSLMIALGLFLGKERAERIAERISHRWWLTLLLGAAAWVPFFVVFLAALALVDSSSVARVLFGWLILAAFLGVLLLGYLVVAWLAGTAVWRHQGRKTWISGVMTTSVPLLIPVGGAVVATLALVAALGSGLRALSPGRPGRRRNLESSTASAE